MRLAHEQGLLHQRELSHFQHWALMYWVYLDRRTANETLGAELEMQCFNLNRQRWKEVYESQPTSVLAPPPPEEEEIPVEDLDELDRWYEALDRQRIMSGADAGPPPEDSWSEWR